MTTNALVKAPEGFQIIQRKQGRIRFVIADGATVLAKMTPDGEIAAMMHMVKLSLRKREVYYQKQSKQYLPTSPGYAKLNQAAGLEPKTPDTLFIGNKRCSNPYVIEDSRGAPKAVYVRKVAVGRTPTGNLISVDRTIHMHPKLVHAQEVLSKFHRDGKSQSWGRLLRADALPKEVLEDPTMKLYYIDEDTVLVADMTDATVIECNQKYTRDQENVVKIAETIAERNVIRVHPAIATFAVFADLELDKTGDTFPVRVISWPEADRDQRIIEDWIEARDDGNLDAKLGGEDVDVDASTTPMNGDAEDADAFGPGDPDQYVTETDVSETSVHAGRQRPEPPIEPRATGTVVGGPPAKASPPQLSPLDKAGAEVYQDSYDQAVSADAEKRLTAEQHEQLAAPPAQQKVAEEAFLKQPEPQKNADAQSLEEVFPDPAVEEKPALFQEELPEPPAKGPDLSGLSTAEVFASLRLELEKQGRGCLGPAKVACDIQENSSLDDEQARKVLAHLIEQRLQSQPS